MPLAIASYSSFSPSILALALQINYAYEIKHCILFGPIYQRYLLYYDRCQNKNLVNKSVVISKLSHTTTFLIGSERIRELLVKVTYPKPSSSTKSQPNCAANANVCLAMVSKSM